MSKYEFAPEVIEALAWLRNGWDGDNSERAITAFETLDNAGVFAALDEQTDYASATGILAESARQDMERGYAAASRLGKLERVPGTDTLRPAPESREELAARHGVDPADVNWNAADARHQKLDAAAVFGPRDVWPEDN
jgi:hypothetical protein